MVENIKDEVRLLWIDMLMQVPGVTEYMAVAITKKYTNLGALYNQWVLLEGGLGLETEAQAQAEADQAK